MTRRLKTAKPTRIKGEPLLGGGIVKESFFKLQSSWDGASKLKKMAFAIRLVCVGIFQAFDVRVNARSSTKAGPIDDHSDAINFVPFAASSANTRKSMEVELAIKWSQQGFFFAARVLGKLSRLKALQRREGEDAGKDTSLQSNEYAYFCDAVCGDIARKTSSPKGH